jgi:hypothetical protein
MTFTTAVEAYGVCIIFFASSLFPTIPGLLSIFFPSLELGQFSRWLSSSLGHFVYLMYFALLIGVNPVSGIQC